MNLSLFLHFFTFYVLKPTSRLTKSNRSAKFIFCFNIEHITMAPAFIMGLWGLSEMKIKCYLFERIIQGWFPQNKIYCEILLKFKALFFIEMNQFEVILEILIWSNIGSLQFIMQKVDLTCKITKLIMFFFLN